MTAKRQRRERYSAGVLCVVIAGFCLAAQGWAQTNGYEKIIERNMFSLKAPTPPEPVKPPPPPASNAEYKLTGITSIADTKRAFVVREIRGQTKQHLSFGEGETQGDIRAVWIDKERGAVMLREGEQEILLSFNAQERERILAEQEEREFNEGHQRAHEMNEAREREREAGELEEAKQQLRQQAVKPQ